MSELRHTDDYPPSSKAVAAEMTLLFVQEEEVAGICVVCVNMEEKRFEFEAHNIADEMATEIHSLVESQLAEIVTFEAVLDREVVAMYVDKNYPHKDGDGYTGGLHALASLSCLHNLQVSDGVIYTTQSHLIHE